jgi:mannose-1-phosphate guanylyltransferase
MNALILSAGIGSRLGALTKDTPKVMLPIKGQPLLDILIKKMLFLDVEKIVINTFYKSQIIEDYLNNQPYSNKIVISREANLLGTAGSLKNNLTHLMTSDFLVMHGDNYFTDDLSKMLEFHKSDLSDSFMTMGTFITHEPELYGVVEIDNNGIVRKFYEKTPKSPSNIANSAIYIFKQNSITKVKQLNPKENDISTHLIPKLIGSIKTYPLCGTFIDVGTPERYELANQI